MKDQDHRAGGDNFQRAEGGEPLSGQKASSSISKIGLDWQISVEYICNSDLPIYPDLESLSVPKTSILNKTAKIESHRFLN